MSQASTKSADVYEFFGLINEIPKKNRGGCLFFCYVFWKWLEKHGYSTETFQIIQYGDRWNTNRNLEWIQNQKHYPVSSYHFTWMYDDVEYDGDGEYADEIPTDVRVELAGLNTPYANMVEDFCITALEYGGWNYIFQRNEAIKYCEKVLELDLSKVPRM